MGTAHAPPRLAAADIMEAFGTPDTYADGFSIREHGPVSEIIFWRKYGTEHREVLRVFLAKEDGTKH